MDILAVVYTSPRAYTCTKLHMRFLIRFEDTFCMHLSSQHTFTFLKYLRRLLVLIFGLLLCSVVVVCAYRSGMGLGPWDVLHQGVSRHPSLSFGQASIRVGGLVILA